MANSKRTITTKATAKKAPGKALAIIKPAKAKAVAVIEAKAAPAAKALTDEKQALNNAFTKALPGARPVFQAKYKPLNLEAHSPQSASARDDAFIKALRTVYAGKPFTQKQSGADSGNLARAINLGLIKATGKADDAGHKFYSVA